MGLFSTAEKAGSKKLKEEGCVVTLQIEVPAAKVQEATHNALVRLQSRARLPGFRPGKAPIDMVRKHLAGAANERVVDELLRDSIPKALAEHRLQAVASPAVHSIQLEPGKPLVFQVDVECPPKFQAKDYKKLPVSRKRYPASDEEINKRLQELREGNARLDRSAKEVLEKEHYAVLDYEIFENGKPAKNSKGQDELLDMSSSDAAEGLIPGLLGAKRNETRDIPGKAHGKTVSFHVTLKEIKEKVLPSLDDEFAKDLGAASLDELKMKLKNLIEEEGNHKSERELIGQIEEELLKRHKFPVPPSLVENSLERMMERVKNHILGPKRDWPQGERDKLAEKLKPKAEDEIRLSYLLRAIAEAERFSVTDADREAELNRNLQEAESPEQKDRVRRFFEEQKDQINAMLMERKTVEFLKSHAAIQDS